MNKILRALSVVCLIACACLAQDAVLLKPVTVDPSPAATFEKPPLETQRLASLQDAVNFLTRYRDRWALVAQWLVSRGVPPSYTIESLLAPNLGDPSQSYVHQCVEFKSVETNMVSDCLSLTLVLRSPTVALVDLQPSFSGVDVTDLTSGPRRWIEPAPPADAATPPPFNQNWPDPQKPACRLVASGDTHKVGDTWQGWRKETAQGWWTTYHRWCPVQ